MQPKEAKKLQYTKNCGPNLAWAKIVIYCFFEAQISSLKLVEQLINSDHLTPKTLAQSLAHHNSPPQTPRTQPKPTDRQSASIPPTITPTILVRSQMSPKNPNQTDRCSPLVSWLNQVVCIVCPGFEIMANKVPRLHSNSNLYNVFLVCICTSSGYYNN